MYGVRLVVAYDGTRYGGWQHQVNARTVQQELEEAIEPMAGAFCRVRGASRTDSGVHAYGQVAAFDCPRRIEPYKWARGLNGRLPADVAVQSAEACEPGYNPRYHAAAKLYRYLIRIGDHRDPLLHKRAWQLGPRRTRPRPAGGRHRPEDWLDLDAMERAAAAFVGTHDFQALRRATDPREDTVRTLSDVRLIRGFTSREDLLALEVRGTAFMHNMMRILAGTLVEVGRERLPASRVPELLTPEAERADAGQTAPAWGLYLVRIELR